MIIRRYLVKQVVSTSLVVIALLTLIMMGGRLIKYFGVAAQGRLDAGILFSIIGYRLPEFLTLILPLGFFIGLMLVFGRLYVDHEMAVLNGSGVSRNQLGRLLIPMTVVFLAVQAVLMLWMAPWGVRQFEQLTRRCVLVLIWFDPKSLFHRGLIPFMRVTYPKTVRTSKTSSSINALKQKVSLM